MIHLDKRRYRADGNFEQGLLMESKFASTKRRAHETYPAMLRVIVDLSDSYESVVGVKQDVLSIFMPKWWFDSTW